MANAVATKAGSKTKKSTGGFLDSITSDFVAFKPKTVIYGDHGGGKTTIGCFWGSDPSKNVFMQAGETGLDTLKGARQVPKTVLAAKPHTIDTWDKWQASLKMLASEDHERVDGTLVIDTLGGVQALLERDVFEKVYHSNVKEFDSWSQGHKDCKRQWKEMHKVLTEINQRANMGVLLLCQRTVENFDPPDGLKYTRYVPTLHKWMWEVTSAWCDMALMLDRVTVIQEQRGSGKAKAKGGIQRILRTACSATHDAKNRYGLPEIITLSNKSGEESVKIFQGEFIKAISERKAT